MRQSSRQKKQVEVYTDLSMRSSAVRDEEDERGADDDDDDDDMENRVNKKNAKKDTRNYDDGEEEEEEEYDDDLSYKKAKPKKAAASPTKKRKSLNDADDEDANGDDWTVETKAAKKHRASPSSKEAKKSAATGNAFYDIISRSISNETAIDAAKQGIKAWLSRYEKSKVRALTELLNSVLYASGANDDYIQSDVNLDVMEKSDFYEILNQIGEALVESGADATDYPLKRKAYNAKCATFRSRFANFWSLFATEMISSIVDSDYFEGCIGMEVISAVIDRFINLSIIGLASVRDSVTEAAISIGKCLLIASQDIKKKVDTVERQRTVLQETQATKTSDKLTDLTKKYRRFESALRCLSALTVLIFQSFFVHRLRDVNDDIRAMCSAYIGDWLRLNPVEWYRDEYLKYLGWMCGDHCSKVRLQTIGSVAKLVEVSDGDHLSLLRKFFDRHMERFVEIITMDVDPEVSLSATQLLCTLQSRGVLTDDSELLVDKVDGLIFDREIPLDIRCEVFSFFRGHAIGFEDVQPAYSGKKQGGTRIEDLDDDDDDEARTALSVTITKQKNALQLRTLCEFAKYHLDGKGFEGATALAEVCLQSPIRHVLLDWPTISTLLLEESRSEADSQDAAALKEQGAELSCYLLPMFLHGAQTLHAEISKSGAGTKDSSSKARRGRDKSVSPSAISWAALTDQLSKDFCRLLLRHRDNSHNVNCLLGLLSVYEAGDIKAFKAILKAVVDLLHSTPNEEARRAIISALRRWSTQEDTPEVVKTTMSALSVLYTRLWGEICQHLEAISAGKRIGDDELKELLCALASATGKSSLLWKFIDCRKFLASGDGSGDVVDVLARVSRFVTERFRSSEIYRLFGYEHQQLGNLVCSCGLVVYSIMLWDVRDGYLLAHTNAKKDEKTIEKVADSLSATIASVAETRRRLLDDLLLDWMALSQEEVPDHVDKLLEGADWKMFTRRCHYDKKDPFAPMWEASGLLSEPESGIDAIRDGLLQTKGLWLLHRSLPREAFRIIGDLRVLFNQDNFNYSIIDKFVWSPSDEVNSMMKRVFEGEGERIAQDLERCPEDKQRSLSNIITTFLIQPMSYAFYISSESMNRRQASAVICYLLNNDDSIVQHVKHLVRTLQQSDLQKCLEINIGALQAVYANKVERPMGDYESSDPDDKSYFDDKDLLAGFESVARLAKILSSLLLEMHQEARMKKAFTRGMDQFFQAVATIALSGKRKYCFLVVLETFLPLLSNKQRFELSGEVVGKLNELEAFEEDLAYIGALSSKLKRRLWKVVTEFQSFSDIELDRSSNKRRPAMGDEDEEEDEGPGDAGSSDGNDSDEMDLAPTLRGLAVGEFAGKHISLGRFAEQEDEDDDDEMEEDAYLSRGKG